MNYGFYTNCISSLSNGANAFSVRLQDFFEPGVYEVWGLSFHWDLNFVVENICGAQSSLRKFVVVTDQRNFALYKRECSELKKKTNVLFTIHAPIIPSLSCLQHSKCMILFFENGVRVVIATANFTEPEWRWYNQGVWFQDFPEKNCNSLAVSSFEDHLVAFMTRIFEGSSVDCKRLKRYDFSSANAALVASVPGDFSDTERDLWGHWRIRSLLHNVIPSTIQGSGQSDDWELASPIVCQSSTIGMVPPRYFYSELLRSFCGGRTKLPQSAPENRDLCEIIYPSVTEVVNSLLKVDSGRRILGPTSWNSLGVVQHHLRLWSSPGQKFSALRSVAAPHIKSYARYYMPLQNDVALAWVLLTSSNLTQAAWGAQVKDRDGLFRIRNFELGVLFLPSLYRPPAFSCGAKKHLLKASEESVSATATNSATATIKEYQFRSADSVVSATMPDVVVFPFPYSIPARMYTSKDKPWHKAAVDWDKPPKGPTSSPIQTKKGSRRTLRSLIPKLARK